MPPKTVHRVCSVCANSLPYCGEYRRCKHCGEPLTNEKAALCVSCAASRTYTARITSAFLYQDEVKNVILVFKKEENAGYAKELAAYTAAMVKNDLGGVSFDFVISVPPRLGKGADGYDQAAFLAKAVAKRLDIPYLKNAMRQTREVKKQSSLSREERRLNLFDVFEVVSPDKVRNKTLLLVDDVSTTGTTLEECAKELKRVGVYRVYGATVAKTPSL